MRVHLKRVYDPPAPGGGRGGDGTRILVDRLWPRGVTRAAARIDVWLRDIAPSTALRKWFDHDPDKWNDFRKKYRAEIADSPALRELCALCRNGKVTLIYAARDEKHNHAVVLQHLLQDQPG